MGVPISKKWKRMSTIPVNHGSYQGKRHDGTLYKKGDTHYLHADTKYGTGWYKLKKR